MPPLTPYAPLQNAIAQILLVTDLEDILCSFEQLVVPLDVLCSGVRNDALAKIDHALLVAAFRSDKREYIIRYDTAFGISGNGSNEHYCFVRNAMEFGRHDRA